MTVFGTLPSTRRLHSLVADHEDISIALRGEADENVGGITAVNEGRAGDPRVADPPLHGRGPRARADELNAHWSLDRRLPITRPPESWNTDQHHLAPKRCAISAATRTASAAVGDPSVPAATVEIIAPPSMPSLHCERQDLTASGQQARADPGAPRESSGATAATLITVGERAAPPRRPRRSPRFAYAAAGHRQAGGEQALVLIASNSAWVIAPLSSSSLALAISAADPPAASRTY